jgi:RNA polymerase sigma-70 factor (ECF subfamily)
LQVWRVSRAGNGFRGEGNVRSWLFTIARRAAWRRSRRRAGEPPHHDDVDAVIDLDLGAAAGWGASPEQLLASAESKAAVHAALATLPDADREILALRDVAGLSGADVAASLGISLAAEKSRLHRARLLLLAALRTASVEHA